MAETDRKEDEKQRFESEIETLGPCKVQVRIRVPVETIEAEFEERYSEIIKTVSFPGFRVGHTPRRLVERKLGDDVAAEVKENLITESFKDAVDQHEIDPISDPDMDLETVELVNGEPLEYSATFLVRPTVEVPDYGEITVKAAEPVVGEDRVDSVLEDIRKQRAVLKPAPEQKVAEGDVAILNLEARVEDVKLVERENYEYHHPDEHVAGLRMANLAEDILGKETGAEFTLTETLPVTWPEPDQAGKEVTLKVELVEVKRHELPELDDAFAEEMDYDTVEELREEIQEQAERQAEKEAQEETDKRIVDALLAASPFEIPEDVVKEETSRRVERTQTMLRMRGANEEEIEEKVAEARSAEESDVERGFRSTFLLDAIAKKEKVLVTEDEVDERVAHMAASYSRTVEEMREYLEQRDMFGSIRAQMREERVMEFLRKKIKTGDDAIKTGEES